VKKGLVFSAALHLALFLALLLGPGPKAFEWDRVDAIPVDLVAPRLADRLPPSERPSIDRAEPKKADLPSKPPVSDVLETPDPTPDLTEPEKPQPTPPPTPTPKPKPTPEYKRYAPPKTDQTSLADRLKKRLADTPTESDAKPTEDAGEVSSEPAPAPSSAPTASADVTARDFPYAWYLNTLRTKIADSWDPPGDRMVSGHGNQVLIRFRVHRDGHVSNIQVDGASGTPGLDASARRAIERASPFPPLPAQWVGDHLDAVVRFNVSEGRG
jgi:TonB family protein